MSEGFPNALVEAMSAGLPCVSFDCDAGPRDIIDDGTNGYLVPLQDIATFSEKLEILMKNTELRTTIGSEAMKIQEALDTKKIADEFLDFCTKEK